MAITANQPIQQPDEAPLTCEWTDDLRTAGISTSLTAIDRGVPLIVLGSLLLTGIVALLAPVPGENPAPLAIVLLVVASLAWVRWLVKGDEGPSPTFLIVTMGPIAALGVGQWFVPVFSLQSTAAYPILALPPLLLAIISLAAIPRRTAIWVIGGCYLAYGGPLVAAWLVDGRASLTSVVVWQVGFVLALVAGYATRLAYQATSLIADAQAEIVRQQAIEERRQIARDVHDVVAHTLAVTMLHITAARMAVVREQPDVAISALEEAERQGRGSLTDIRGIVRLLRDDQAESAPTAQPGLDSVQTLVAGYRNAGLPVDLVMEPAGLIASPSAELALFRVLQEALTNAARHGTGPAQVDLRATPDGIRLEVTNPAPHITRRNRGSGLVGMQERIVAAAGSFDAGLRDDRWIVQAIVPAGTPA